MPKGRKAYSLSDRLQQSMANEHAGICDYIKELEPYARENPDDRWASGQLRYFYKRKRQLEEALGIAKNRKPR